MYRKIHQYLLSSSKLDKNPSIFYVDDCVVDDSILIKIVKQILHKHAGYDRRPSLCSSLVQTDEFTLGIRRKPFLSLYFLLPSEHSLLNHCRLWDIN